MESLEEAILGLTKSLEEQMELSRGMMQVIDMLMTMNSILNQRLAALEARATMSIEDIMDGKEPPPVGPTEEHVRALMSMADRLKDLTDRANERVAKRAAEGK